MNKTDRHAVAIPKDAPYANELGVGARFYSQRLTDPNLYVVMSKDPFTVGTSGGGEPAITRESEPVWPEAQAAEREVAVRTHRALQEAGAQYEAAGLAPSFTPTPAVTNDQWHAVIERAWRFRNPDSDYHPGAVEITQRDLTLAAAMQAAEQRANQPPPMRYMRMGNAGPKTSARTAEIGYSDWGATVEAESATIEPNTDTATSAPIMRARVEHYVHEAQHAADVEAAYREGWTAGASWSNLADPDDNPGHYWEQSKARAKLAT